MCIFNYNPLSAYANDDPESIIQTRGGQRLAWIIPVEMSKLGASIDAYSQVLPQVNTLRLCHRFRDCTLSKLPLEILDQVIEDLRRSKLEEVRLVWLQDFTCFQGLCRSEDHYIKSLRRACRAPMARDLQRQCY